MSFMSMRMLARSRRNTAAEPLADRLIVSFTFGAVELHDVFVPVAAVDDVAALAGVPHEEVLAVAEEHGVVAPAGIDAVVAVAAEDQSAPSPVLMVSLPFPPSTVNALSTRTPAAR